MGAIRLYMTMSLDGYVAGPDDTPDAPLGVGGFRLFNWLDLREKPGPSGEVYAEAMATRAVISGRRTFELANRWHGDHHDGVPIFVLTHDIPKEPPPGSARYVTDVHEAAHSARAAAGDEAVLVHGAGAAQALLRSGELDELELHVVPVLLGQGRRLFDNLPPDHVELELVRRMTTSADVDPERQVTHLRYRVAGPTRNAR
ncbi:dihydrofolate reductase family protein [Actinophytocola gossypii]|uniref:Dihydrofolate reductase family protein n=1 Tax=Actinophytocola gossypii TaxID=2812003 RepID=A0ABT2J3I5_9PSEU|nr:dihydrofolate reductase family protein [Actinophytocola gossypii]MCT2582420.1 dihydrofolate reductase family protein [Actinophytocola gossypii]